MIQLSRSIKFSLVAGALAVAVSSCGSHKEGEEKKPADATAQGGLKTFKLSKGTLTSSVEMPGELVAFQQVDLYAKVNGFIKKMYADVGSNVTEGQLLAVMEAPELQAQLTGAESKLNAQKALYLASKATYDRLLRTSQTPGTVSQNDLDVADARQKSDLAQLEASKAAYREVADTRNYLEIRAPFSGIITARNVSAGAYAGPSGKGSEMPIFTLQEQKKLRLVISIPDAYVNYTNNTTEVSFTVKSLPGEKFKAKVVRLAGALDNKLRSQRTEMDIVNTDMRLLPGMIANVTVPLQGTNTTYVVPSSALLRSTEGDYVIKVDSNKTIWVPITIGSNNGDKAEIYGPIQENDVLVTTATEEIRNNAPVK